MNFLQLWTNLIRQWLLATRTMLSGSSERALILSFFASWHQLRWWRLWSSYSPGRRCWFLGGARANCYGGSSCPYFNFYEAIHYYQCNWRKADSDLAEAKSDNNEGFGQQTLFDCFLLMLERGRTEGQAKTKPFPAQREIAPKKCEGDSRFPQVDLALPDDAEVPWLLFQDTGVEGLSGFSTDKCPSITQWQHSKCCHLMTTFKCLRLTTTFKKSSLSDHK